MQFQQAPVQRSVEPVTEPATGIQLPHNRCGASWEVSPSWTDGGRMLYGKSLPPCPPRIMQPDLLTVNGQQRTLAGVTGRRFCSTNHARQAGGGGPDQLKHGPRRLSHALLVQNLVPAN